MTQLRVALLYNLKDHIAVPADAPRDALAEYDTLVTVQALKETLQNAGHEVIPLEADTSLVDTIRSTQVDICFNIAEGLRGDSRELQVPALLEMLGVPYTGSKVLANALSLDKAATKQVWRDCGLRTAPFQVFRNANQVLDDSISFPLFVKPLREGSGMGINPGSVVYGEDALREQVDWVIRSYAQPALVETFLSGREFTVGILGNRLTSWESSYWHYDQRGFCVFPVLEIDVTVLEEASGVYGSYAKSEKPLELRYLCPAPIEPSLQMEMQQLAVAAYEAIGALDVARVDFRLDSEGMPHLLEINTLPGLNPEYSDIVIAARAAGVSYAELVSEILTLALQRYGLVWDMGFARRIVQRETV